MTAVSVNTLEDLFDVHENNLRVADLGIFELKGHKSEGDSLVTLLHCDPLPKLKAAGRKRESSPVQYLLLPKYGWPHRKYPGELSFRQTIRGDRPTDRGFSVKLDREKGQMITAFDPSLVDVTRHKDWFESVKGNVGLGALNPTPYWPISLLEDRTNAKLTNVLFVEADASRSDSPRSFKYGAAYLLRDFRFERLLTAIDNGYIFVDYDASTRKNHGTKLRMHHYDWDQVYDLVEPLN